MFAVKKQLREHGAKKLVMKQIATLRSEALLLPANLLLIVNWERVLIQLMGCAWRILPRKSVKLQLEESLQVYGTMQRSMRSLSVS